MAWMVRGLGEGHRSLCATLCAALVMVAVVPPRLAVAAPCGHAGEVRGDSVLTFQLSTAVMNVAAADLEWLKTYPGTPWDELPLAVIDFETVGVEPTRDNPVSVAAVRFEGGQPVATFTSLLHPGCPIPPETTAFHHITDDMVVDAPTLPDVLPGIAEVASMAVPVAYNAPFDRTIMHRLCGAHALASDPANLFLRPTLSWLDVMVIVRKVDRFARGQGRFRLGNACERHGVVLRDVHSATGDATATGELLFALRDKGLAASAPLGATLKLTDFLRRAQDADFEAFIAKVKAREERAARDGS